MKPIEFAIVGAGWRAEFFLRIAKALPDRFRLVGIVVRNADKGKAVEAAWAIPIFRDTDSLLAAARPAFVVVSVPQPVAPLIIAELVNRNVAILTETPPAPTREGLLDIWKLVERGAHIQVAEQYIYQPLHSARLALIRAGKLGEPSFAQVSACHGYHGTSLIRHFLKIGFELATVTARAFEADITAGPGRAGPPEFEKIGRSRQVIAQFDFGHKLGIYDFTGDQYFSWIRSHSVLVRGPRGEIRDQEVRILEAFDRPSHFELLRQDAGQAGNLEGLWHKGYSAGVDWAYLNPFPYAPLSDDEIAIASVLAGMAAYVEGVQKSIASPMRPKISGCRWRSMKLCRRDNRQSPRRPLGQARTFASERDRAMLFDFRRDPAVFRRCTQSPSSITANAAIPGSSMPMLRSA